MASKNIYDVVLEKVGNQQLKTTKALCSALGLGLAAAKGMMDKAPTTVAKGLDKDKALALKKELEDLGNTVSIPGMETKAEAPATKKTTTTKKQTTKKSAPSSSKVTTPSNDDFDAIFGGDTAQKEAKPKTKTPQAKIDRIEFDNGDVYEGEMANGLRHGKGKYTWANGDFYEGKWAKGWRCGFGIYKSHSKNEVDGSTFASYVYEGDWKNSKKHGHGVATGYKAVAPTGRICFDWSYDGEWIEDNRHGNGKYTYADGSYFTGVWKNNKKIFASETVLPAERCAKSTVKREELKNGDVYEGEYKDGKYHGQGKYTSSKGWVYEGQFTDGQITGKGKITYATGAVYEGELLKGNKNGFGRITYTDGLYYEGEWKDDKKHGKSTYTQKLGSYTLLYTGVWNMSKRTGPHDYYSITNPEKKVYRQFYDNDEAVGSEFCPVGVYANWTMADAVANKKRVEAEHRQYWEDQKAREAAQSRTSSTARFDDDAMADLRYLYEMKSSGGTLSWSAEEQQKYQNALLRRKGDRDGVALAYVKQQVYANSLSSFEDVNFCIYLLNEIIPRKNTLQELAICYYRKGWVQDASGCVPKRGLLFYDGRIQDTMEVLGGQPFSGIIPYSDEIMARRLLDKVIFRLKNTTNPANILRGNKYLQEKVLLAEAYVKFAKISEWQYQLTEIKEDLITLKSLM